MTPLTPEQLWWRPNEASNSAGNLVLHLAGNARQWVVHGLGGRPDVRDRPGEFAAGPSHGTVTDVLGRMDDALGEVSAVLARIDPVTLPEPRTIQGVGTTGLRALYHVVEHFSMHTGQILYIAKLQTGRDLGFYELDDGGAVVGTHW